MSDATMRLPIYDLNALADAVTKSALAGTINHVRLGRRMTRLERLSARTRKGLSNEALAFGMGAVAGGATVAAAWLATMSVREWRR